MASELDIKRILGSLRLMRVFMKFKTSRTERQLLRMQAKNNVILLEEGEDLTKLPNYAYVQNFFFKCMFFVVFDGVAHIKDSGRLATLQALYSRCTVLNRPL